MKPTILSLVIGAMFAMPAHAQSFTIDPTLLGPPSEKGASRLDRLPHVPNLNAGTPAPSRDSRVRPNVLAQASTPRVEPKSYEPRIPNLPTELHTWSKPAEPATIATPEPAAAKTAAVAPAAPRLDDGIDWVKLEPAKPSERAPALLAASTSPAPQLAPDAAVAAAVMPPKQEPASPMPVLAAAPAPLQLPQASGPAPSLPQPAAVPSPAMAAPAEPPVSAQSVSADTEAAVPTPAQPKLSTATKPSTRTAARSGAPKPMPAETRVERGAEPRSESVQLVAGPVGEPASAPVPVRMRAPSLDTTSREAVRQSQEFMARDNAPAQGDDGRVVYTYGAGLPTVVCAPLRVCSIELQPGERVNGALHAGDTVRWHITPAETGVGKNASTLVIIKPKDIGLETNLLIPTDRRVYFVRLLSRATDFTARVSFAYPDDVRAAWDAYQQRQADQMKMVAAELPPASIDKLFFGYEMQGDQKFRPVRVFDDGQKTYIQLPEEVRHREQPSLVVLGKDGKEQLVNYRTRNDYFIVDRLFDRAALILGVGGNQEKVTIERRESKGAWSWFGFGNRTASRSTDSGAMLSGVENVQ